MKKDELRYHLLHSCLGRKRAVSATRLRVAIHVSENELRKAVNRLRREGVPIASDQTGYYYAQTAGEVYSTIKHLKKMRSGLDAAIEGLEGSLDSFAPDRG